MRKISINGCAWHLPRQFASGIKIHFREFLFAAGSNTPPFNILFAESVLVYFSEITGCSFKNEVLKEPHQCKFGVPVFFSKYRGDFTKSFLHLPRR
jgi:hypothetical protein